MLSKEKYLSYVVPMLPQPSISEYQQHSSL